MIRTLNGTVTDYVNGGLILDVAGVGYRVFVSPRTMPPLGSSTRLFIHHHVREQEQSLYGFPDLADLATFESLLSVSGIGPKSALAALTIASAEQLERAIEADDVSFFASVPGLGKKTAAKIIVELKGKLASYEGAERSSELTAALEHLGYRLTDIAPLLRTLPTDLTDTERQLGWLLRQLGKG